MSQQRYSVTSPSSVPSKRVRKEFLKHGVCVDSPSASDPDALLKSSLLETTLAHEAVEGVVQTASRHWVFDRGKRSS
eukprot:2918244-Rhodomonas_salina.1